MQSLDQATGMSGKELTRDEVIDLFEEKFGKLQRSSVWSAIEEGSISFSLSAKVGEPVQIAATGPGEEALDAFALTLRFFLQDNEPTSIRRMAALVEGLPIPEERKEEFRELRTAFNAAMDRPCGIQIDDLHPTHREVLDIFLYGGLAHANPQKRQIFLEWSKHGLIFGMIVQVFYLGLRNVIYMIAGLGTVLAEGRPSR